MKSKSMVFGSGLLLLFAVQCFMQTTDGEKKVIAELLQESYIEAAHNNIDIDLLKKGFHESCTSQGMHHNQLIITNLEQWIMLLEREKELGTNRDDRTTADIEVVGMEGDAAVARVDVYTNRVHSTTDFLSLCKFSDGWKVINRISQRDEISQDEEYERILRWEKGVNEKLQPPEKVMDAIGVKRGMTIGEIGVGYGRYTVHLARRVGDTGKIYANDIDKNALDFLRKRCQRENIANVEIILGKEDDPLFPEKSLDMAFMVWVFHGLDRPGPLFKNIKSGLKPGALLVIVDPVDSEIDKEREYAGEKIDPDRPTIKQRVEIAAEEAGFEIIRIDAFLPKDYIWFLKVKDV